MTTAPRRVLLAIDTSTTMALVALGATDGRLLAEDRWAAGFRHGEELLARIDGLLRANGCRIDDVSAIAVGTGPGAFTGLRVGLATAKGLALALRCPMVGIPSGAALLEAASDAGARGPRALLLPAGPADRILVLGDGREPAAVRLAAGEDPAVPAETEVVAVDLEGRADADAIRWGRLAREGLARTLLRLATERLATHGPDDLAGLVPEYVTLPRGIDREAGRVVMGRA